MRPLLLTTAVCLLLLSSCGPSGGNGNGLLARSGCGYAGLNETISGRLSGEDPDGRRLTFSIAQQPSKGSVTLTNALTGDFTYTPHHNARGVDTFTFRVSNGQTTSSAATYRIVYTPRILPLGDSITEGTGADGSPPPAERVSYRRQLYDSLTGAGYRVDFVGSLSNGAAAGLADPDHEGHPGWCDDNAPYCGVSGGQTIDGRIDGILASEVPDVILLHIGTNHFDTNGDGINSILNRISAWAQGNHPVDVFLARIIPTLDGSLDVNSYNNNLESVAGARPGVRIRIVDQQGQLRGSDANRANPAYMADNLHPNAAGYERMAARWYGEITANGALARCP